MAYFFGPLYILNLCSHSSIFIMQLAYSVLKLSALQCCHLVTLAYMLKNLRTETNARKSRSELAAKWLYRFYRQRCVASNWDVG